MDNKNYSLDCGGLSLRYSFIYPETRDLFKEYLTECPDPTADCDIRITPEYMDENQWLVSEDETSLPFIEFQCLMLATGNALLSHKRALFHGAALLWKGCAWILTGPSGTGKTTQLRHWRNILKRDARIINGDKPLLVCREDGSVWVCSSPWRGKEKFGLYGQHAPLGGIILLRQGTENRIRRMDPGEAVLPLFTEFVSFPERTDQIIHQGEILKQILDAVPVWELVNLGDESSACLTLRTLESCLEDEDKKDDKNE